MRIALVAPLYLPVPPPLYGGTERVIAWLAGALTNVGHEVTIFCSGDSIPDCSIIAPISESIWQRPDCRHEYAAQALQLRHVIAGQGEFDIIHFHSGYHHLALEESFTVPVLTTFHGRLDRLEIKELLGSVRGQGLASISDAQRAPVPEGPWFGTVHNGLPRSLYSAEQRQGRYLSFIGRFSPEKGVVEAIRIAKALDMPIRIAGAPDKSSRGEEYFQSIVAPLFRDRRVEYVGEIGDSRKQELIGGSCALLFPIRWPEPFGLAIIEAMACGTPIVAFRAGAVGELIEEGKSGILVAGVEEAVERFGDCMAINRAGVRECFERRFDSVLMAQNYFEMYGRLIGARADGSL